MIDFVTYLCNYLHNYFPFGWLGNALLVTGAWRLAHKHRHAFLFTVGGGICWLHEAYEMHRWDWMTIEVVMICVTLRNYYHWGQHAGPNLDVHSGATEE